MKCPNMVDLQLDIIQANVNVKQWVLMLDSDWISDSSKERLQNIINERNDNSLCI